VLGRLNHNIIHNTMAGLSANNISDKAIRSIVENAIDKGQFDAVQFMDQATKNETLSKAIDNNDIIDAEHLLNNGAVFGTHVLYNAAFEPSIKHETFKFLCDKGAPLNDKNTDTVLHRATRSNDVKRVEVLLSMEGVKGMINCQNTYGNTPLNSGLYQNLGRFDKEIVRLLIRNNASLDIKGRSTTNVEQMTSRMLIAKYLDYEFFDELNKHTVDDLNVKLTNAQTEIEDLKDQLAREKGNACMSNIQLLHLQEAMSAMSENNIDLNTKLTNTQTEVADLKDQLTQTQQELTKMNEKYAAIKSHLLSAQNMIDDISKQANE